MATQMMTYAPPSPGLSITCERHSHRSVPSYSVAALWWGAEAIRVAGKSRPRKVEGKCHGVVWRGEREPPSRTATRTAVRASRRVVVEVFADLHEARRLKSKFPAMSRGALQEFEHKAWNRLIDYLIKLPPLPSDN